MTSSKILIRYVDFNLRHYFILSFSTFLYSYYDVKIHNKSTKIESYSDIMKAYMIVFAKITDMDKFQVYSKSTAQLLPQFGGRYITIGRQATTLEGAFGQDMSIVVSEWPSREAVEKFWYSDQYQAIKKLRQGTGDFNVTIVDDLLEHIQKNH